MSAVRSHVSGQVGNVTFVHFPQHGANDASVFVTPRPARGRRRGEPEIEEIDAEDLVQQAALGDIDAAAALTARYRPRLRALARALVADEGVAKDIVEAAFEEAFRGWPPERGRLDLWFARIVRREARRRKSLLGL